MLRDFELLGLKVQDCVTKRIGVVTSLSYDLYGCVQAVLTPFVDGEGKPGESQWYDSKRLQILDAIPVMKIPSFESPPGGQPLPLQNRY
jgi:hypothetical protein